MFGGVGSAVIAGEVIGPLGVAFAFGISLLAMAYAIGPISGCHINPAVTVGLLVSKRITVAEAVQYWIGQVIGAIVAAFVLFVVIKSRDGRLRPLRATASAPTATAATRPTATRSAAR